MTAALTRIRWRNYWWSLPVIVVGIVLTAMVFRERLPFSKDISSVGHISLAYVQSQPEAKLYYPGSSIISTFGAGEGSSGLLREASSAYTATVLSSTGSQSEIYNWYDSWLKENGWRSGRFIRASHQTSIQGYDRGDRESFSIAMDDPAALADTIGQPVPSDMTVFEITYMMAPTAGN